jgi:antitoxin CptB
MNCASAEIAGKMQSHAVGRVINGTFLMDGLEIRRKRALYRAYHRGTKELDLILGRYAKEHVPGMDEARLTLFEHLLSLPDADIDQWIRGHETPDDVAVAVAEVREFYGLGLSLRGRVEF